MPRPYYSEPFDLTKNVKRMRKAAARKFVEILVWCLVVYLAFIWFGVASNVK